MANNHTANTANPMEYLKPGLGNTSSFQSSGKPWAKTETITSGNSTSFNFSGVTKFVSVTNGNSAAGENLKVAFSELGLGTNYFLIGPGQTVTLEVKVTDLFLAPGGSWTVTASVCAGVTNIPAGALQGNWSGSAGVG